MDVKAHQVAEHTVREHTRTVNVEAKHYLADTVEERMPEAVRRTRKAVFILATTGKLPNINDLRR